MRRLLLCRPLGGLNDSLNQLWRCHLYAKRHERELVVDLDVNPFLKELFGHLSLVNPSVCSFIEAASERWLELNQMSTYPVELRGRLNSYATRRMPGESRAIRFDRETGVRLSFDFDSDYQQQLLVHHSEGGGADGVQFLKNFAFSHESRAQILDLISKFGTSFDFVHLRATDYSSDLDQFARELSRRKPAPKIYLATDNYLALQAIRERFPTSEIMSLAQDSDYVGRPIHRFVADHGLGALSFEGLRVWAEICLAARACTLFYSRIVVPGKENAVRFSGFTVLLRELAGNQRDYPFLQGMEKCEDGGPRQVLLIGLKARFIAKFSGLTRTLKRRIRVVA